MPVWRCAGVMLVALVLPGVVVLVFVMESDGAGRLLLLLVLAGVQESGRCCFGTQHMLHPLTSENMQASSSKHMQSKQPQSTKTTKTHANCKKHLHTKPAKTSQSTTKPTKTKKKHDKTTINPVKILEMFTKFEKHFEMHDKPLNMQETQLRWPPGSGMFVQVRAKHFYFFTLNPMTITAKRPDLEPLMFGQVRANRLF